jgi:hypothetical protein
MSGENWPTALVSLNNSMTIGALKALRSLGLSIPADVALVCYDFVTTTSNGRTSSNPTSPLRHRTSRRSAPPRSNCFWLVCGERVVRRNEFGCPRRFTTAIRADVTSAHRWDLIMPIAAPDHYVAMLDRANEGGFAYPAINVTSSQTLNAALEGFAEADSDGIIQVSLGTALYLSGNTVQNRFAGSRQRSA